MINHEHPIVKKALADSPDLFKKLPFIENGEYLSKFGIHIPDKSSLPSGFIKLYPEDFIVEEIDAQGVVRTIDSENTLSEQTSIIGEGDTIYATLVKCGLSTLEAVRDIASKLQISEKSIGYAGIKDKHAITSQRISIRGASEDLLKKVSSPFYFLKDVSRGKGVIGMTNLEGNRFSIFIRTTDGNAPSFPSGNQDFYNYFYLQRFGSPRFVNYLWGFEILRGNYESAIRSVMFDVQKRELPFISSLRKEASTKKTWQEVKSVFDPILNIMHCEASMLEHLIRHPSDFKGALAIVPDQVQLWLYGLASLLFNEKISQSIQKGMQPPDELPFIFSYDRADIETYKDELRSLGIFPPPFHNLKPFPFIRLAHRTVRSIETASNIEAKDSPTGTLVSFSLPKGAYATTFLSHYVNLVADSLPEGAAEERIEGSTVSSNPARAKTIDLFRNLETKPEGVE